MKLQRRCIHSPSVLTTLIIPLTPLPLKNDGASDWFGSLTDVEGSSIASAINLVSKNVLAFNTSNGTSIEVDKASRQRRTNYNTNKISGTLATKMCISEVSDVLSAQQIHTTMSTPLSHIIH